MDLQTVILFFTLYTHGEVVYINTTTSPALGVQVQIRDTVGKYWRYCHMVSGSVQVSVGDSVTTATPLGRMGMTGNATGIHLHLECASTMAWRCDTFLNPATVLNIPNVDNTIIHYNGVIPPTPPTPTSNNNSKKWGWYMNMRKVRYNI